MANEGTDPETERIELLLDKVRRGAADDAESEELALYANEHPGLASRIERSVREGELSRGWLQRIEGDQRLQQIETSRLTRAERGVGLALLAGGLVLGFLLPLLGMAAWVAGTVVLLYSFIRVRIQTHRDDPYKDVMR